MSSRKNFMFKPGRVVVGLCKTGVRTYGKVVGGLPQFFMNWCKRASYVFVVCIKRLVIPTLYSTTQKVTPTPKEPYFGLSKDKRYYFYPVSTILITTINKNIK